MHESLDSLYVELESIELDLILKAQNNDVACLSPILKRRAEQLGRIGSALGSLKGAEWSGPDRERALALQDRALARNKRIVMLLSGLYTSAKEEFLKLMASRAKASPYVRPRSYRRRVIA